MATNLIELVFILDRSGSMSGLESDTLGGFNALLAKQKGEPGKARITTVLFNNAYDIIHDRLDLDTVSPLTEKEYFVGGSTALLDAIGRSIQKVDRVMASTAPAHRPDKVMFAIITDGMENASRRFTRQQVAEVVKARRDLGWEFLFLGANMDAITVAQGFGIDASRAQTFVNDSEGVALNFQAVSDATSSMRRHKVLDAQWSRPIRERGVVEAPPQGKPEKKDRKAGPAPDGQKV